MLHPGFYCMLGKTFLKAGHFWWFILVEQNSPIRP